MKRRCIRQVLLLSCLLLLAPAVLAACGSGDDDDDTGDTGTEMTEVAGSTATEESTEAEAATETEAEGTSEATGTEEAISDDWTGENTWEGTITFGDFNWASAVYHNRIMQYIIEHGWGYETDTITATTAPMVQGLKDNDVQVVSEMWMKDMPDSFFEDLEAGELVDLGANYKQTYQGWFVPTYVIEGDPERGIEPMAPELDKAKELGEYADLFEDPTDPDKGRFVNGVPGWDEVEINKAMMEAFGIADEYNSFAPGSQAAEFASLANAYREGEPWLGYLWAPSWPFAIMDLTMLEMPPYSDECWSRIRTGEVACAYHETDVNVIASPEFVEQAPDLATFFRNYSSTIQSTSEALQYIHENEASPEEAALRWLKGNEDTWSQWVPDEVAQKVSDALAEED